MYLAIMWIIACVVISYQYVDYGYCYDILEISHFEKKGY